MICARACLVLGESGEYNPSLKRYLSIVNVDKKCYECFVAKAKFLSYNKNKPSNIRILNCKMEVC